MRKNTIQIVLEDVDNGIEMSIIPLVQIPPTGELTDAERTAALIYKLVKAAQETSFNPSNN